MDSTWYYVYIVSVLLFVPSLILGTIAQRKTVSTFDKYSKYKSICGVTAVDFVTILLSKAGITDVEIVQINGKLTDCYDHRNKILRLSDSTINSISMTSLGICAHEIGHAIQHHEKMTYFSIRNAIIPVMNIFAKAFCPLVIIGSLISFSFNLPHVGIFVLWGSVILYGISFLFYLITFPIEFNASKRAVELLKNCDFFLPEEIEVSKKVLNAAIWTYISALISALLFFINFLSYDQVYER